MTSHPTPPESMSCTAGLDCSIKDGGSSSELQMLPSLQAMNVCKWIKRPVKSFLIHISECKHLVRIDCLKICCRCRSSCYSLRSAEPDGTRYSCNKPYTTPLASFPFIFQEWCRLVWFTDDDKLLQGIDWNEFKNLSRLAIFWHLSPCEALLQGYCR